MTSSARFEAALHPNAEITIMATSSGPILVIDDFFKDPVSLRQQVIDSADRFVPAESNYPGNVLRADELDHSVVAPLFHDHLRSVFGLIDRYFDSGLRFSHTLTTPAALAPRQTRPHQDFVPFHRGIVGLAAIVYLFDDPTLGGTSFYEPVSGNDAIPPAVGYQVAGDDYFKQVHTVPALFNRCVIFESAIYHSGDIAYPDRLSQDLNTGRLTFNLFLKSLRTARSS